MTMTRARWRSLVRAESVAHIEVATSASETVSGTITTTELDRVDQRSDLAGLSDSGIDANVQRTLALHATPPLKIMNPSCPVRYIPIHIW